MTEQMLKEIKSIFLIGVIGWPIFYMMGGSEIMRPLLNSNKGAALPLFCTFLIFMVAVILVAQLKDRNMAIGILKLIKSIQLIAVIGWCVFQMMGGREMMYPLLNGKGMAVPLILTFIIFMMVVILVAQLRPPKP